MIGALQWAVTIGRFDINTLVASSDRISDGIPNFSDFPKIPVGTPFRSELGIVHPSVLNSEKFPNV
jgi:hypothetical protein